MGIMGMAMGMTNNNKLYRINLNSNKKQHLKKSDQQLCRPTKVSLCNKFKRKNI